MVLGAGVGWPWRLLSSKLFTINVQNQEVEPPNRDPDLLTFRGRHDRRDGDRERAGATLGILKGHDPDSNDPANSLTYLLPRATRGRFEVVNGVLKLKDGVSLDYETATSYTVTVQASDGHGGLKEKTFTINVQNVVVEPANQNPDQPDIRRRYDCPRRWPRMWRAQRSAFSKAMIRTATIRPTA